MEPTTLIILGASGDLTSRLLVPALAEIDEVREGRVELVGAGRSAEPPASWMTALDEQGLTGSWAQADAAERDEVVRLLSGRDQRTVLYLALPPSITASLVESLQPGDLPENVSLVLEKPFGVDAESARALEKTLTRLLPEERIVRVDHFLGSASVLTLLGLRFANRAIDRLWHREALERIEIIWEETLALEGRAGYYDAAGALVDMVQSHLLLVAAIALMDAPARLNVADLRAAVDELLARVRLAGEPQQASRRARYSAGQIDGVETPDYVDEIGVDAERETETWAEIELEVDHERWRGVPIVLRTGKALARDRYEIVAVLREPDAVPEGLHEPRSGASAAPASLRLPLDEGRLGLEFDVDLNGAGDPRILERRVLSARGGEARLSAYGEVLTGILTGDHWLSIGGATAIRCWEVIAPVREAWARGDVPIEHYPAGSQGPPARAERPQ